MIATYEPLYIDNYLSEVELPINKGDRLLLSAPTGSGKTTYAINDRTHKCTIVAVPSIAIGLNKETKENPFFYNGKKPEPFIKSNWYCTYDNLLKIDKEILKESIIYIDEIHLLGYSSYRTSLPTVFTYIFKYAKTVVGISGTLDKNVFKDSFTKFIEVKKRKNRENTLVNVVCDDVETVEFALKKTVELIERNIKVIVVIQSFKELKLYVDKLKEYGEKRGGVIGYKLKHENGILKYVSEESRLTVKNRPNAVKAIGEGVITEETLVICGTSSLIGGWDLNTDDVWNALICGNKSYTNTIKTPESIVQIANRPRNNLPIKVYVQRNTSKQGYKYKNYLTEDEIISINKYNQKLKQEVYDNTGNVDRKYLVELPDSAITNSSISLIEIRQSNINKMCAYNPFSSVKHDNRCKQFGVSNIKYEQFIKLDGDLKVNSTIEKEMINVLKANPHNFNVTEKQVDGYLSEENGVVLPYCIEQLIFTCGEHKIKAKDKIELVMKILNCYGKGNALKAIENGVSLNQLNTHSDNYYSKGIPQYGVVDCLIDKFCNDEFYSVAEVKEELLKIHYKHYNGYENKKLATSKSEIKTLLGGYINFTTKRQGKKKIQVVKLNKTPSTTFAINGKHIVVEFNIHWVEEKIRNTIQDKIKHAKNKSRDKNFIDKLKKDFAKHVEYFDYLD